MTEQTEHRLNETAEKITLKTSVKRGTGTRDQDKLKVKVKGDDAEETVEKLERVLKNIDDADIATQLRGT